MKLCKDCKHYVAPSNPQYNYAHDTPYYHMPMCGHPEARRSVVNGEFLTSCVNARGASDIGDGTTFETICGKGAELFEAPPPLPTVAEAVALGGSGAALGDLYGGNKLRRRWITRFFGG